jgi:hypothetical protein
MTRGGGISFFTSSICIPNAQDRGAAFTTKGDVITIPKAGVEPTLA